MKKLSYLTLALALTFFVACKGKEKDDDMEPENMDTMNTSVESGASETLSEKEKTEAVLNQSSDDELFGTDVPDEEVDKATKK